MDSGTDQYRIWLAAALIALAAVPAGAQVVRTPDLKLEYHRAERAWRTGSSLKEAKARLDHVLVNLPEDGPAHLLRARVLMDLGEPEDALPDARAATALMPDSGEAFLIRCEAARESGEISEALESLDRSVSLIKEDAPAHVRLSHNALRLGANSQAEALARVAVALDNRLPGAYRQLAHVFMETNRPEDAARTLARGLREEVLTLRMLESDRLLSGLRDHPIVQAAL